MQRYKKIRNTEKNSRGQGAVSEEIPGTYNAEEVVGGGWVGARVFFGEVNAQQQERMQRRRRR